MRLTPPLSTCTTIKNKDVVLVMRHKGTRRTKIYRGMHSDFDFLRAFAGWRGFMKQRGLQTEIDRKGINL